MEPFQIIMIMVAILQPMGIGLLGWALFKLNKLDREVGEQSVGIKEISKHIIRNSEETTRQLERKQNKD